MIAYAVYYTLKPFWWVLLKYKHFRTIEFQLQATPNELILTEPTNESRTAYSTFEHIIRRKHYFVLRVQNGLKIYLPTAKLSEETITVLAEKVTPKG